MGRCRPWLPEPVPPPGPSQATLSTARLNLRPRTRDDFDACLEMDLDPEVGRFLYPFGPPTRAEREAALEKQMAGDWPPIGGTWAVEWLGEPGFLGWCGLFPLEDSGLFEIGYRYTTAAWGRGVATEAGARVLEFGFRDLGLDPIVAVAHPNNAASHRVLTKIGLKPGGLRFHYGLDLAYFELARADHDASCQH